MAKALVDRNTIVFVGDTKVTADRAIKGYARVPDTLLLSKLQIHAGHVVRVNEFRTTVVCSFCHMPMHIPANKHRYLYCGSCKRTWNRDINAGINIMVKGEQIARGLPIHDHFSRMLYPNIHQAQLQAPDLSALQQNYQIERRYHFYNPQ